MPGAPKIQLLVCFAGAAVHTTLCVRPRSHGVASLRRPSRHALTEDGPPRWVASHHRQTGLDWEEERLACVEVHRYGTHALEVETIAEEAASCSWTGGCV